MSDDAASPKFPPPAQPAAPEPLPRTLRYVTDATPGITRHRRGKGFSYRLPDGGTLRDPAEKQRIASLVIPPAYRDVWICVHPRGHLQATGRDAAGRKQYRYHVDYQQFRQQRKYANLVEFGDALAALRRRVNRDLKLRGLPREKVLAAAVRLMDLTLIRAGHGGETGGKPTYGLATLREKHLDRKGSTLELSFRGKSGQKQHRVLDEPAVAKVLRKCHGLPGRELFRYLDDDGDPHRIDAADINEYLADGRGSHEFTAKDFRTWGGTVLAACRLASEDRADSPTARDRQVVAVVKHVAAALGNRPATCRKYYIHPAVLRGYEDDRLAKYFADLQRLIPAPAKTQLSGVEEAVLDLLRDARKA